jgi:hypothetical protein
MAWLMVLLYAGDGAYPTRSGPGRHAVHPGLATGAKAGSVSLSPCNPARTYWSDSKGAS